ncbi:DUF1062 domain-containing protein [Micromonospora sp. M12]
MRVPAPSGERQFRVNANHKLLDVWLRALRRLRATAKFTVLERMTVRSIPSGLLDRLHANDPGLIAELLQDPVVQRRNRFVLDWTDAWRLDTDGSEHLDCDMVDVAVRFAARIPVRPVRLIADGFGLSRARSNDWSRREGRFGSPVERKGLRRLHLHVEALSPRRRQRPAGLIDSVFGEVAVSNRL